MANENPIGSLNFAMPTLTSTEMSKDDQGAILVTQATAIIIVAWLKGWESQSSVLPSAALATAINDVQNALKSF